MTVFINAGHHLLDPGGFSNPHKENQLTIELRNAIESLFVRTDLEYGIVPDELNLRQSIDWINKRADENDIAFSIHFNAHSNKFVLGTEAYFFNNREHQMAEIFSRTISKSLGINNRGAKADTLTWVGSLGWVRRLKCDSVLVEVCYLTSPIDMARYDVDSAARGFLDAVREILPRKEPEEAKMIGREADLKFLKEKLTLLQRLVVALNTLLALLIKKKKIT